MTLSALILLVHRVFGARVYRSLSVCLVMPFKSDRLAAAAWPPPLRRRGAVARLSYLLITRMNRKHLCHRPQ